MPRPSRYPWARLIVSGHPYVVTLPPADVGEIGDVDRLVASAYAYAKRRSLEVRTARTHVLDQAGAHSATRVAVQFRPSERNVPRSEFVWVACMERQDRDGDATVRVCPSCLAEFVPPVHECGRCNVCRRHLGDTDMLDGEDGEPGLEAPTVNGTGLDADLPPDDTDTSPFSSET